VSNKFCFEQNLCRTSFVSAPCQTNLCRTNMCQTNLCWTNLCRTNLCRTNLCRTSFLFRTSSMSNKFCVEQVLCRTSFFRIWFESNLWKAQKDTHTQLKPIWSHAGRRPSLVHTCHEMTWNQLQEKFRGRCYDDNFLQISTIFGEKNGVTLKNHVMNKILHNLVLFWVQNANFVAIFCENIFKILTSVTH
jgi:hypothetical protein